MVIKENNKLAAFGGIPSCRKNTTVVSDIDAILADMSQAIHANEISVWRGGRSVHEFECQWARLSQIKSAVMTNSGTSALHCAFIAAGLAPGDQVLIPSSGYVSAASAVMQVGAVPVICDIDPVTWSINFEDARSRLTNKTKAVVAIHMWGIPCPMQEFQDFASEHGLALIEDCAQAHFAQIGNRCTGSFGNFSTYSFAPGKVISTGQGGMVTSNDITAIERVRRLIAKGKGDNWHDYREMGFSYEATELQAILGLHQLRNISENIRQRIIMANMLQGSLNFEGLNFKVPPDDTVPSYFKIPVLISTTFIHLIPDYLKLLRAENINIRQTHPPMHQIEWVNKEMQRSGDSHIINKPRPAANDIIPRILEIDGYIPDSGAVNEITQGIIKVNSYLNIT